MPDIVSIRFKPAGQVYYFDSAGIELKTGDRVVVETTRGQSIGRVIAPPRQAAEDEQGEPLKPVIRKASREDIAKIEELRAKEKEAVTRAAEVIAKHELPMRALAAEYNLDGSHLTIYFSAEEKVDFRVALKELGSLLKTRVELRQTGARDVAKLLGGIGRCGRPLCCATHLSKFDPITVRMARNQDLPLNPTMISGLCGKLLCCLKYEHQQYLDMKAKLPAVGKMVETPHGPAKVISVHPVKDSTTVQLENGVTLEFRSSELKPLEKEAVPRNDRK